MATDLAEDTELDEPDAPESSEEQAEPSGGFKLTGQKLKVVVLLLVVMGVQMAVGYMLLPAPASTSMETEDDSTDGSSETPDASEVDTVEVDLGSYNPTNSRGPAGSVIHVSFNLTAIVASNNKEDLKKAVQDTHGARIRAAVIRVIRSSNLEDLNDPDFNVIKRKIRSEINKVLQKTYINEVVLDRIRLMPQ